MVRIISTDLTYPASAEKKIIEMFICMRNGRVIFNSGLECEILPAYGHFLDDYEFDSHTRIVAYGNPGVDWVWTFPLTMKSLERVKRIIFNGDFAGDLLTGFLLKLKTVKAIALTYFAASSFTSIIENIVSPHLRELTCHVIGTPSTMEESFTSLRGLGRRFGDQLQLEKLMLIFGDGFNGRDIAVEADMVFGNILHLNAVVVLLFSHEVCCMRSLLLKGYVDAGKMTMAKNNPELRETDEKMVFETYFLFKKSIDGKTYLIGCRKAPNEIRAFPYPPIISSHLKAHYYEHIDVEDFDIYAENQGHIEPAFLENGKYGDFERRNNRVYDAQLYPPASDKRCCNQKKFLNLTQQSFAFPGWSNTRIIKILLYLHDSRYMLSNGLIFKLPTMDDESKFYIEFDGSAAHRLTITCTTQDRRFMVVIGLSEFLANVQHLDVSGFWWTDLVDEITKHLSSQCKILSMIRMKMDRKVSCYIIQRLKYRQNVERYFYDARDTAELSLARVINSIIYHGKQIFNELKSLILMARCLQEQEYWSSWEHALNHINEITGENAVITIVLHELPNKEGQKILEINLYDEYDYDSNDVLVPGIFSSRPGRIGWSYRMRQYTRTFFGKTWNFIFPIPPTPRHRLHGTSNYNDSPTELA